MPVIGDHAQQAARHICTYPAVQLLPNSSRTSRSFVWASVNKNVVRHLLLVRGSYERVVGAWSRYVESLRQDAAKTASSQPEGLRTSSDTVKHANRPRAMPWRCLS